MSDNTHRTDVLNVRFGKEEKRLLRIEAAHAGKTMSEYARDNLMRIVHKQKAQRVRRAA